MKKKAKKSKTPRGKVKRKAVKKKVAKKKPAKRKVAKRKKKATKRKPVYVPGYSLHTKKLEIMREIPIMPCSVLSKDKQGLRFAHTQAEKVYQVYRRACESRGLVINRVEGKTTEAKYSELFNRGTGWEVREVLCARYEGVWEICDVATGETERLPGAGDGDNNVWSVMSAQTNAKKQALLDYFEVAWPQPTDWVKVIRESLEELGPQELAKAVKMIIPEKIAKAIGIVEAINAYFEKALTKKGAKKK